MRLALTAVLAAGLALAGAQPSAAQAAWNAREPGDVAAMINRSGTGARARLAADGEAPMVVGSWRDLAFAVKFVNCNAGKDDCAHALYVATWDVNDLTLAHVNHWNDYTFLCPAYMDTTSSAIMWMGVMAQPSQTEAEAAEQFDFFTRCMESFERFLADPGGFERPGAGSERAA